jgi:hypothetical protein
MYLPATACRGPSSYDKYTSVLLLGIQTLIHISTLRLLFSCLESTPPLPLVAQNLSKMKQNAYMNCEIGYYRYCCCCCFKQLTQASQASKRTSDFQRDTKIEKQRGRKRESEREIEREREKQRSTERDKDTERVTTRQRQGRHRERERDKARDNRHQGRTDLTRQDDTRNDNT